MSEPYNPSGVFGLLSRHRTRDPGYTFLIPGGDLNQMSIQYAFLKGRGLDAGLSGVYPAMKSQEDYVRALGLIWQSKVAGWWNLQHQFVKNGVCTEEEFRTELQTR